MERPGRCYPAAVLVEPAIACFGRLRLLYILTPISSIFLRSAQIVVQQMRYNLALEPDTEQASRPLVSDML